MLSALSNDLSVTPTFSGEIDDNAPFNIAYPMFPAPINPILLIIFLFKNSYISMLCNNQLYRYHIAARFKYLAALITVMYNIIPLTDI